MNRTTPLNTISRLCRIFILTFVLLISLMVIQMFIHESFWDWDFRGQSFEGEQNSSNNSQEIEKEPIGNKKQIDFTNISFLPDGTINLDYPEYKFPNDNRVQVNDINNNPVWQGSGEEYEKYSEKYLKFNGDIVRFSDKNIMFNSINAESRNSILVLAQKDTKKNAYWKYNNNRKYFEEFNINRKIIGYCGSNGFVSDRLQLKLLEEPLLATIWMTENNDGPIILWWTRHDIFEIDFGKNSIESLLHLPEKDIIEGEYYQWMMMSIHGKVYPINDESRPLIMCRTKDNSVFVILRNPSEIIQTELPEEIVSKDLCFIASNGKVYLRVYDEGWGYSKEEETEFATYEEWTSQRWKETRNCSVKLFEIKSSGDLKLLNKLEWTLPPMTPTSRYEALGYPNKQIIAFLSIFSTSLYDPFYAYTKKSFRYSWSSFAENPNPGKLFLSVVGFFLPRYSLLCYLISLLIAGIVFFHSFPRRKSWIGLFGWVVFAFLFNVVGLLVYFALNFTPVIKCHNCNKKRGLNTPECPRCGAVLSVAAQGNLCIITES